VLLLIVTPLGLLAESQQSIFLYADLVRGHENPQGPVCELNSRFRHGEMVTWRVRLVELTTGIAIPAPVDQLLIRKPDKDELAAMTAGFTVSVHLSDGQDIDLHFGPHPGKEPTDYFWTGSWLIPEGYPTGTIDYWISAKNKGNGTSGKWYPFNVGLSKLTIEEAGAESGS
jgi:hypothetical protein